MPGRGVPRRATARTAAETQPSQVIILVYPICPSEFTFKVIGESVKCPKVDSSVKSMGRSI